MLHLIRLLLIKLRQTKKRLPPTPQKSKDGATEETADGEGANEEPSAEMMGIIFRNQLEFALTSFQKNVHGLLKKL